MAIAAQSPVESLQCLRKSDYRLERESRLALSPATLAAAGRLMTAGRARRATSPLPVRTPVDDVPNRRLALGTRLRATLLTLAQKPVGVWCDQSDLHLHLRTPINYADIRPNLALRLAAASAKPSAGARIAST